MSEIEKRLEQLADDVAWFVRAGDVRLLSVSLVPVLREPALRLVLNGTRIAGRPTPFVLIVDEAGAGWGRQIEAMVRAHASLVGELAKRGTSIAAPGAADPREQSVDAFAARIAALRDAASQVLAPPVVVLAPEAVRNVDEWTRDVVALLESRGLQDIRWVTVLEDGSPMTPIVERLGDAAVANDCRPSMDALKAEADACDENAERTRAGAPPLAFAGYAWPRQLPANRRIAPGVSVPQHVPDAAETGRAIVHSKIRGANRAARAGQWTDALRLYREAYDAAVSADLIDERLTLRSMMATTIASLGDHSRAIDEFHAAQTEATNLGEHLFAAQAAHARAALYAATSDQHAAVSSLTEAATAAKCAGAPGVGFAIESYRAAGQMSLSLGLESQAAQCFRDAIALADNAPVGTPFGGAVEAARTLAKVCRARGLEEQAASLEAQAETMQQQHVAGGA